jgi:hypothetical protein
MGGAGSTLRTSHSQTAGLTEPKKVTSRNFLVSQWVIEMDVSFRYPA